MGTPYVVSPYFALQCSFSFASSAEQDVHSVTKRGAKDAKQPTLERI
jgi:hypothetical protein